MVHVTHPVSALAEEWRARLRICQDAIAREPLAAQGWHWRVQIKVLRFLLARYGNQPESGSVPAKSELPLPKRPLFVLFGARDTGKAPRTRQTIRHTLERIAKVNQEVDRHAHRYVKW